MPTPSISPRTWHVEVRKARKQQRMTQRGMEELTGIYQSRISQIEKGLVDPKLSEAVRMARSVGLEFALVPRHALPVVYGLLREPAGDGSQSPSAVELVVGRGDGA